MNPKYLLKRKLILKWIQFYKSQMKLEKTYIRLSWVNLLVIMPIWKTCYDFQGIIKNDIKKEYPKAKIHFPPFKPSKPNLHAKVTTAFSPKILNPYC